MKRTALYCRVSTENLQDNGLKSQKMVLLEYCKNHGIENPHIYEDKISGGTNVRPQLERLQKDIFVGKIDTVITYKIDRISRSIRQGINIIADWLQRDVRIICVAQQFDFSGVLGQMVASLLLGIAEMERQNICENVQRGIRAAIARGVKFGGSKPKYAPQEILQMKNDGMTISQIAQKLKCSRQTIYTTLSRIDQILCQNEE